jgi:hypothetical protein
MSEEEYLIYLDGLTLVQVRTEALIFFRQATRWRETAYEFAGRNPVTGELV